MFWTQNFLDSNFFLTCNPPPLNFGIKTLVEQPLKNYDLGLFLTILLSKPNPNSTQLNSEQLKVARLRLSTVATWNPPPQTFQPPLDHVENRNLAQTLT